MKKVFKTFLVVAVTAVAGYNIYQSNYSVMNNLSEFALANVEALASDSENDVQGGCYEELVSRIPIVNYDGSSRIYYDYKCKGGGLGNCKEGRVIVYLGTKGQVIGGEDLRMMLYCI